MRQFPHCDAKIVHSPQARCRYCNESGLQEIREAWGIAYTGESDAHPELIRCPAEQDRPVSVIHKWGGNRPCTPEHEAAMDEYYASVHAMTQEAHIESVRKPGLVDRFFDWLERK